MARPTVRKNAPLLRYLAAALFAASVAMLLRGSSFYPAWLLGVLALSTAALALVSPAMASLAAVIVLALPVLALDLIAGLVVLIAGIAATQYLATGTAAGFLLVMLAGLSFSLGLSAGWAFAALAGYLLGRGRGAASAGSMAVLVIGAGLLVGADAVGSLATGGSGSGLIGAATVPQDALAFGWLPEAIRAADPGRLVDLLVAADNPVLLALQPVLWAVAAVAAGIVRDLKTRLSPYLAVLGAVGLLAAGSIGLDAIFAGPLELADLLITGTISALVALAVVAVTETAFPALARVAAPAAPAASAASAEDADVDELLRMIANAEDELTTRHRTQAVVLITDMKSFSAMTEQLGSVESAKIVQRHRDLLLPIIGRNHGKGKPTGGDGHVAAFDSSRDALSAAIEIQRALDDFGKSERSSQEILVRIGIAAGEVVLDKGGRPFLGSALNLAARVMDLADGGRILVTGGAAATSGFAEPVLMPHGEFKLKNIAEPVPVVEVAWRDGQTPQEIRAS